ncbi:MAG: crossover junction endodeoxyribonuclease RuvC [Chloroflexi bacterium]|nr:crossover junction endodeoxyribonuclease RuvC [Chloroflexota bacterium]
MPSLCILGIDPGTLRMGYAVLTVGDDDPAPVAWGVLAASGRLPLGQRLYTLHTQLLEIMERHHPTHAAAEEPFVSANVRTALAIGQAQGLALLAAAQKGVPLAGYSPRQVKLAVTGNGAATKDQVQQAVAFHLRLSSLPTPTDASDALAVALCHWQALREEGMLLP